MQVAEHLPVAAAVSAVNQLIQHPAQLPVLIDILIRIIASKPLVFDDLLRGKPEDKGVFFADFIHDLYIGTVHCSQCQCSVHHEFHIAGAAGFPAGRRNLLGYIGSRKDHFGIADPVVFNEDHFDLALNALVGIDHAGHIIDQPDDQFGPVIRSTGLGAENKRPRIERHIRIFPDFIIQIHNMQNVQQLPFVFMQPLDLYIENGIRVYLYAGCFQNVFCQPDFVFPFDPQDLLLFGLFIGSRCQFFDFLQIGDPGFADMFGDPVGQQRIAVQQESSLGDTVGLIAELLRHHLIEFPQLTGFEDLGMQLCHTVYRETAGNSQIGHPDLSVVQNGHLAYALLIVRVFRTDLLYEPAVDLIHDLIHPRQQPFKQLDRPFFQCFRHDRMGCVSACMGDNFPCLIPFQFLLIQQQTHQFRHSQGRMRVVHVEDCLFMQLADVFVIAFVPGDRRLQAGRDKEILLFQTQLFSGHIIIVRIQHTRDRTGQVFLLYRFLIIPFIKRLQLEILDGFRIPDPERVDDAVSIPDDRQVIRNSHDRTIVDLTEMVASRLFIIIHFDIAAEPDLFGIFRTFQFKRIAAVFQPAVRFLHLLSVFDTLPEHTVVITDPAAICGIAQRGKGIQEARRQTAQAAVPQCRVPFFVLYGIQINMQFLQCFFYFFIRGQRQQVIAQIPAGQKLHGHVIHDLGILHMHGFLRLHPVVNDLVLHHIAERLIHLLRTGILQCGTEQIFDLLPQSFFKYIFFYDHILHIFLRFAIYCSLFMIHACFQKTPEKSYAARSNIKTLYFGQPVFS